MAYWVPSLNILYPYVLILLKYAALIMQKSTKAVP